MRQNTLQGYGRDMRLLIEKSHPKPPLALSALDLEKAALTLVRQGLGPRSLARAFAAWRSFYGFLEEEGKIAQNPAGALKPPRYPRPLPRVPTVDEMAGILETAPKDGVLALRDVAMAELFYSSGLRVSELCALEQDAAKGGWLKVRGKGGKQREVPVGKKAQKALAAWLLVRPLVASASELALFVNAKGLRIGPRGVQMRIKMLGQKLGAREKLYPHLFRHSAATHLLASSKDLRGVQEFLGHESVASTQLYTHLGWESLLDSFESAHPRAKKSALEGRFPEKPKEEKGF